VEWILSRQVAAILNHNYLMSPWKLIRQNWTLNYNRILPLFVKGNVGAQHNKWIRLRLANLFSSGKKGNDVSRETSPLSKPPSLDLDLLMLEAQHYS